MAEGIPLKTAAIANSESKTSWDVRSTSCDSCSQAFGFHFLDSELYFDLHVLYRVLSSLERSTLARPAPPKCKLCLCASSVYLHL
jgi:hypothetical protein